MLIVLIVFLFSSGVFFDTVFGYCFCFLLETVIGRSCARQAFYDTVAQSFKLGVRLPGSGCRVGAAGLELKDSNLLD